MKDSFFQKMGKDATFLFLSAFGLHTISIATVVRSPSHMEGKPIMEGCLNPRRLKRQINNSDARTSF